MAAKTKIVKKIAPARVDKVADKGSCMIIPAGTARKSETSTAAEKTIKDLSFMSTDGSKI